MTPLKKRDQIHLKRGRSNIIETVFASDPEAQTVTIKTQGCYLPGEVYSLGKNAGQECGFTVCHVRAIPNRDCQLVVFVAAAQASKANRRSTAGS